MTLIRPDLNDRSVRNEFFSLSVPWPCRRAMRAREGSKRIAHAWSEMVPNRPEAGTELLWLDASTADDGQGRSEKLKSPNQVFYANGRPARGPLGAMCDEAVSR